MRLVVADGWDRLDARTCPEARGSDGWDDLTPGLVEARGNDSWDELDTRTGVEACGNDSWDDLSTQDLSRCQVVATVVGTSLDKSRTCRGSW